MILNRCPYDPETGTWILSSRWLGDKCEWCHERPLAAVITTFDEEDGRAVRLVCLECSRRLIAMPKKERS